MDLVILLAPSRQPTRCLSVPAAALTDGFLAAMVALTASRRRNDSMRSGRCPPCGFGKWRDLEGARVLEDRVGDRSDCDVSDDQGEKVGIRDLGAKIVPVLSKKGTRTPSTGLWSPARCPVRPGLEERCVLLPMLGVVLPLVQKLCGPWLRFVRLWTVGVADRWRQCRILL